MLAFIASGSRRLVNAAELWSGVRPSEAGGLQALIRACASREKF